MLKHIQGFIFLIVLIILYNILRLNAEKYEINTFKFIEEINNEQEDWIAGYNEITDKDETEIKRLMGLKMKTYEEKKLYSVGYHIDIPKDIPKDFDARKKWKNCASISSIKDQANCGSCWAVSAASTMSDRLCVATNHKVHVNLSANALMTCCSACTGGDPGCEGGYIDQAWKYLKTHGLVTGGDYGSKEGCQPYGIAPCRPCSSEAVTPPCYRKKCTNKHYKKKYKKDIHKGKNYFYVPNNETLIKAEILQNGPVQGGFEVYQDFINYKKGVYKHVRGSFLGLHAIKILGWGVENNKNKSSPYWIVANSWTRSWGDNGYFKMLRGSNECGIEDSIFAGILKKK